VPQSQTQASTQSEHDALRARVAAFVTEKAGGPAAVLEMKPLLGGACQDNVKVEIEVGRGPMSGRHRLVLRSDAPRSLPQTLNRADEFHVIRAALAAGVRTPDVRWPGSGLVREGAGSYFMDWKEGVALGAKVTRDPALEAARGLLPLELARELAKVHTVRPPSAAGEALPGFAEPAEGDAAGFALGWVRRTLEELEPAFGARPQAELALRQLRERKPAERELVLVHGDFRTGNFLVTEKGLSAVLDWEFAHWGSPYEDLSWVCVRDWRFGRLTLPVGGFARREPFVRAYEEASGRRVDAAVLRWWEAMGNLRWAIGCMLQANRWLLGAQRDLELLAIGRRAVEMEWETLRLLGGSP
jgi:aminoglycoside phosphotransferase (APT) family kinase protein